MPEFSWSLFVLQLFKRLSTAYDHSWPIGSCSGTGPGPDQVHSGSYVLDKFDIEQIGDAITAASVRKIVLNTDYSLSPGTFNSYAERTDAPINNTPVVKTGKLTLKSVSFLGKGGADLTPPLRFEYDLPQDQQKRIAIFVASLDPSTRRGTVNAGTGLREGDLITFPIGNNRQAYAVILSEPTIGTSTYKVYYLTDLMPTVGLGYNTVTTKNPPYNKDASDMWGMYKADYRKMENENLSRIVTDVSAKSLDVWNLRRITTPLGAVVSVGYEADDYQRAVLAKQSILRIKNVEFLPDRKFKVYFWENENVDELLNIGDTYGSLLYAGYEKTNGKLFCDRDADGSYEENCGCEGCSGTTHTPAFIESKTMTLRELSSNYAIFQDSELYTKLTQRRELTGSAFYAVACGNRPLRLPCIYVSQGLPEAIFGGYLFSPSNYETKGGGVRVSSIQLSHDNVDKFTTYTYKNNLQSSGFTSYEPIRVIEPIVQLPDNFASIGGSRESYIIAFTRELRNKAWSAYSSLLMLAWEIPAPGVTYEHVTVEEYIKYADEATPKQMPGKTTYEFEVFKENMVRRRVLNNQNYNLIDNDVQGIPLENGNRIKTRRLAMEDYTTRLGGLRRVVRYDKQGNKLTETVNHYLHDGLENDSQAYKAAMNRFNNQGVIQENFADARFVKQDDGKYDLLGVMSRREQYPSIQTGTTTINYRTGLQERTENLAFDFYSGALTKSLTVDGYGNRFMSVSVPAYTQYPAMGLKTVSATNKHMLTQTAASYVYKVDAQNNPVGLLGASVQTWSDRQPVLEAGRQVGIWRKEASYSFVPQGNHSSGITPMERFIDFNFTSASTSNPNWRKEGEITLYDVNSKALEATDMNGNHAATKLGYNQTRPIATGTLANYHEIAFSGAEDALAQDMFGGGVLAKLPGANSASVAVVSGTAHSGAKSLQINGGQSGFIYRNNVSEEKLQAGRKYIARVWVRNSAQGTTPTLPADARLYYKINGQTYTSASPVAEKQADGWYALHFTVAVPADALGELEVGCLNAGSTPLYFDDFRFQPQDGGMTAYVYDTFSGELTYILDNNNLYTRYEYDAVGRLVRTYRETFQYGVAKIKETRYNYARK